MGHSTSLADGVYCILKKRKEDANSDTLELLDYYLYEPRSQQTATTTWRYDDWRVSLFMDRTGHTEQYYGEKEIEKELEALGGFVDAQRCRSSLLVCC